MNTTIDRRTQVHIREFRGGLSVVTIDRAGVSAALQAARVAGDFDRWVDIRDALKYAVEQLRSSSFPDRDQALIGEARTQVMRAWSKAFGTTPAW